ncbi:MAG: hypothetical protein LBT13_10710 [Treponema sp.]|jgi:hypothetical protein|nr:hypothetical protein [Treponema sp.]
MNALLNQMRRLSLIAVLSMLAFPLFAHPMQEAELNAFQANKSAPAVEAPIEGKVISLSIQYDQGRFIIEKGDKRLQLPLSTGLTALKYLIQQLDPSESDVSFSVEETPEELILTGDLRISLPHDTGQRELKRILERLENAEPESQSDSRF